MFKTLLTDRETIEHKYHEPGKEYNPINRFGSNYHGYEYDESTGLDDAQIERAARIAQAEEYILDYDDKYEHQLVKSDILVYVSYHRKRGERDDNVGYRKQNLGDDPEGGRTL